MRKNLFVALSLLVVAATLLGACATPATPTPQAAASQKPAAQPTAAPAAASGAKKPYIPVISKGFQHQFWQAVKQGSEKAAKDLNVDITF
ncbi:MAG TPA: BMP family ABC transporter substrate-binding protein, partial [Anaerolineae bacterium]